MKAKLSLISIVLLYFSTVAISQSVAVNDNGAVPDACSILDINTISGNKGLLIPRIDLDDASTEAPVTSPVEGLIVYNDSGSEEHGFYYWNGSFHPGYIYSLLAAELTRSLDLEAGSPSE